MWFNITMQLHQKVDQLGHILLGANKKSDIAWPRIRSEKPSYDDGLGSGHPCPEEKSQTPVVKSSENKLLCSPAKVGSLMFLEKNY